MNFPNCAKTIKFMIISLQKSKVIQSHRATLILFSVIVFVSPLVFNWFWGLLKFPSQGLLLLRVAHSKLSPAQRLKA